MIRSSAIVAKILFIPVSIVSGMVAGLLAKKAFDLAWARVSNEEAPEPEHLDVKWGELIAALAIHGCCSG
jgi:archaellum component FlaG (FlaF/FlaG flagellin family)